MRTKTACRSVLAVPDEDGFRRWLTWAVAAPAALADLHQPPYGERAVVLAATGELVGLVGLVPAVGPFDQLDGAPPGGPWTPELGLYWALAPAHRGHGYATEAAAALCRALFAALHPKRLIAMTERTNTASQAVMRRLGMTMRANPTTSRRGSRSWASSTPRPARRSDRRSGRWCVWLVGGDRAPVLRL